ncbi:ABC transporter ATP-binding protein [Kushneria aurantia]|uniref:ABC transporter ATP-binding protein n=1 Tax=Kushneria aurantia TaxID=504092 RepID=A0ABV6G1B8_9GAMM|nr:ABC transporter ATP-binding protein [Kushneria aurantia]
MPIEAHEVSWSTAGRLIVDRVSLALQPGQTVGLLGPNGAGKSSLLRLLCGLRRASAGVITFDEVPLTRLKRRDLARRLALVEQSATTDADITVLDVVRLGRTPWRSLLAGWRGEDSAAVEQALARVAMSERRHQQWHTLSGGERQRVHIARALAQQPGELLLDEPTNHLDIQHQLDILALIRRLETTCVMALHDLNLAAMFCDQLVLMKAGRVVAAGEPASVLTPQRIHEVYGVAAVVERSPHHGCLQVHYLPRTDRPGPGPER